MEVAPAFEPIEPIVGSKQKQPMHNTISRMGHQLLLQRKDVNTSSLTADTGPLAQAITTMVFDGIKYRV
jgi:hypothetical protein